MRQKIKVPHGDPKEGELKTYVRASIVLDGRSIYLIPSDGIPPGFWVHDMSDLYVMESGWIGHGPNGKGRVE